MVRRALALLLLVFAFGTLPVACGGDDGGQNPQLTSEEPTEGPPPVTGTGTSDGDDGYGG